jgi:hypothetical protein
VEYPQQMPIALLIADVGDTRDAVGLFLAGLGWTTVPLAPEATQMREAAARIGPELVAIDFRGCPEEARACLRELEGNGLPVYLFNAPEDDAAVSDAVVHARGPQDVPRAPRVPAHPHVI